MPTRFAPAVLEEFNATKHLYIRSGEHRYIAIWVVVIEGHVVVRSWNDKPAGWYRAFLAEPHGEVRLGKREVGVRAVPVRSKKLKDAVQAAYAAKYNTKGNAKYVEGFGEEHRKAATLELVPADSS